MSRKPKKGYFVRGQFVAEGSELDLELKRELKGTDEASKTDLKRESAELQKLGEDLLVLKPDAIAKLNLSEKLVDAITQVRTITNFEGRRRQMQFIGKLMRKQEAEALDAVRVALDEVHGRSAEQTLAFHQAEQWRDDLIADDAAQDRWLHAHPRTDTQQLRSLIRQARKDAKPSAPGLAPRHGKAYRELFQMVRDELTAIADPEPDSGPSPANLS